MNDPIEELAGGLKKVYWNTFNTTTSNTSPGLTFQTIDNYCPLERDAKNHCKYHLACNDRSKCIFKLEQ